MWPLEIIPSFELLELINNQDWERTYFEKDGDGLNIYMLDKDNRVLKRLPISPDLLYMMAYSDVAVGEDWKHFPSLKAAYILAISFSKS